MEQVQSQERLDLILTQKTGFLRNAGTSASRATWHRLATLKPQQGFCGSDIMIVRPGGYTKYFARSEDEVPADAKHCPSCWLNG